MASTSTTDFRAILHTLCNSSDHNEFWHAFAALDELLSTRSVPELTRGEVSVPQLVELLAENDVYVDALLAADDSWSYRSSSVDDSSSDSLSRYFSKASTRYDMALEVADDQSSEGRWCANLLGWTVMLLDAALPDNNVVQQNSKNNYKAFIRGLVLVLRFLLRLQTDAFPEDLGRFALRLAMGIVERFSKTINTPDGETVYSVLDAYATPLLNHFTTCLQSPAAVLPLKCMMNVMSNECAQMETAFHTITTSRSTASTAATTTTVIVIDDDSTMTTNFITTNVTLSRAIWAGLLERDNIVSMLDAKTRIEIFALAIRVLKLPIISSSSEVTTLRDTYNSARGFVVQLTVKALNRLFPVTDAHRRATMLPLLVPYIPLLLCSDAQAVRACMSTALKQHYQVTSLNDMRKQLLLEYATLVLRYTVDVLNHCTELNERGSVDALFFLYPALVFTSQIAPLAYSPQQGLIVLSPGFGRKPAERETMALLWLAILDLFASSYRSLFRIGRSLNDGTDESAVFDLTLDKLHESVSSILDSSGDIFVVLNIDHNPIVTKKLDPNVLLGEPLNKLLESCTGWLKVLDANIRTTIFRLCLQTFQVLNNRVGPKSLEVNIYNRWELIAMDSAGHKSTLDQSQREQIFTTLSLFQSPNYARNSSTPNAYPLNHHRLLSNEQEDHETRLYDNHSSSPHQPAYAIPLMSPPHVPSSSTTPPHIVNFHNHASDPVHATAPPHTSTSNASNSFSINSAPVSVYKGTSGMVTVIEPNKSTPIPPSKGPFSLFVRIPPSTSQQNQRTLSTSESAFDKFQKLWKDRDQTLASKPQSSFSNNTLRSFPIAISRPSLSPYASIRHTSSSNSNTSSRLGQLRAGFRQERERSEFAAAASTVIPVYRSQPPATSLVKRPVTPPLLKNGIERHTFSDDSDDGSGGLADLADYEAQRHRKPVDIETARTKLKTLQQNKKKLKTIDPRASTGFVANGVFKRIEDRRLRKNNYKRFVTDVRNYDKQLLTWDCFANGPVPILLNGKKAPLSLRKVPDTFEDVAEYMEVFEPLLLLETWQQMQAAREETDMQDAIVAQIDEVDNVDQFLNLKFQMTAAQLLEKKFSENDVLLLLNNKGVQSPGVLPSCYLLAKVIRTALRADQGDLKVTVHLADDPKQLRAMLRPGVSWKLINLFSLTTTHREYAALASVESIPLQHDIMSAYAMPLNRPTREAARQVELAFGLNQPQAEAVLGVLERPDGLTLIQGPPGTGKTKTILGLLGSLLSKSTDQLGIPVVSSNLALTTSHVLVCAPSNAAVDELTRRIRRGLRDYNGQPFKPRIVRVGASDAIHRDAKPVTLDELLQNALNGDFASEINKSKQNLDQAESAFGKLLEDRRAACAEMDRIEERLSEAQNPEEVKALELELRSASSQRQSMNALMDDERGRKTENSKSLDALRARVRMKILNEAQIVICTLSSAGHELLTKVSHAFDVVIIDEAAQCVELSSLVPLKYGCRKCVLVGDSNQLPPTVLSQLAQEYSYQQSMFVRIQSRSPESVHLLSIQYRMHPHISYFPSKIFYASQLKNGVTVKQQTASWHSHPMYSPFRFFNVFGGKERSSNTGHSLFNQIEAELVVEFVHRLCNDNPEVNFATRIGIITPYKQQLREIKRICIRRFGQTVLDNIDINTIDGFQGQEKDIIVMSCVRANMDHGIGFLSDVRRMNVGLTRSRLSLFIFGHSEALTSNTFWNQLIAHAKEKDQHTDVSSPLFGKTLPRNAPSNLYPPHYQPLSIVAKLPPKPGGPYIKRSPFASAIFPPSNVDSRAHNNAVPRQYPSNQSHEGANNQPKRALNSESSSQSKRQKVIEVGNTAWGNQGLVALGGRGGGSKQMSRAAMRKSGMHGHGGGK